MKSVNEVLPDKENAALSTTYVLTFLVTLMHLQYRAQRNTNVTLTVPSKSIEKFI